jgi:hypothetical protein
MPGDWIILASDGIATLEGAEIGDIAYANRDAAPEVMADRLIAAVLAKRAPDQDNTTVLVLKIAGPAPAVAAPDPDEAPTRLVRSDPPAAALIEIDDIATTQRIVQPPAITTLFRRHRTLVLALGMGLMFVIGWALRALLG